MSIGTKVVRDSFFVLRFPDSYKDIDELHRFKNLMDVSSHLAMLRASRPESTLLANVRIMRVDVRVELSVEMIEEEEG
jgi:hypothetical protein